MDEEEESYMAISESSEGYLSVECFLYRVYNVEGTARTSGEGKIYCLKNTKAPQRFYDVEGKMESRSAKLHKAQIYIAELVRFFCAFYFINFW